jgi:uncharacterized membrane protein
MSTISSFLKKPWLYLFVIIFGTFLKFYNLNIKLFWQDEISTVLFTSGLKERAIENSIVPNQIIPIGFYDSLLHPHTKQYSFNKQVAGILSDTHLTPAHYVFLTLWYRLVGDESTDYRLFSVFAFLLSLPFMFLLTRALFDSTLASWIAISLYAVSPFIHVEAQEARYYSLWVAVFILLNYLFLKASNQNKLFWWLPYSFVAILALYTSALSGILIFGHLLYILLYKKEQRIKFSFSLFFVLLAYLPWIYFLFTVRETIQSGLEWHKLNPPPSFYSLGFLFFQLLGFTKSFSFLLEVRTYANIFRGSISYSDYLPFFIDLLLLGLILYAILFLCTKTSKEKRAFLLLIFVPLFLFFYISDIIRDAYTSRLWRYQIVNLAVITLIITNLLHDKIAKGKILFSVIYAGLVTLGIFSILKIGSDKCWYTRPDCPANIEEAQHISHARRALLITDFSGFGFANFLAILKESKTKNADIIYIRGLIPDIKRKAGGKAYSDIYVMQASENLAQGLKIQFGKKMVPQRKEPSRMFPQIWHVKL